ncbi:MAG: hypothetical protein HY692_09085, partial [Cyanobacteria bacterium NC_groundwater_1444_Ag_S-0.65um_54_12]|nr:hypothetical protein [Cyanobacteria bacterium NC_groundwater_1444_Ag_S-0.65um_54_12]
MKIYPHPRSHLLLVLTAALLAGCPMLSSGLMSTKSPSVNSAEQASREAQRGSDSAVSRAADKSSSPVAGAISNNVAEKSGVGEAMMGAPAPAMADVTRAGGEPGMKPLPPDYLNPQYAGLKGGELDDNASFEDYLKYLDSYSQSNVSKVDVTERFILRVVDQSTKSVPDAVVTVQLNDTTVFTAKSGSNGRVLFFPKASPLTDTSTNDFTVKVTKGNLALTQTLARDATRSVTLTLPGDRGVLPRKLDLAFVLDVTGSMG